MAKDKWIDLRRYGIYMGRMNLREKKPYLVIIDMEGRAVEERLKEIGFVRMKDFPRFNEGFYESIRDSWKVNLNDLGRAFNIPEQIHAVPVDEKDMQREFQQKFQEKTRLNIRSLMRDAEFLGESPQGHAVYRAAGRRFVLIRDSDEVISDDVSRVRKLGRPWFLLAANRSELLSCAQGVVRKALNGGNVSWKDLTAFAQVVFENSLGPQGVTDSELRQVQEAVEAAATRMLTETVKAPDQSGFAQAQHLYFGLPADRVRTAQSMTLQQYSTPAPMALLAQRLLLGGEASDGEPKTLLEPSAGHGALFSVMPPNVINHAVEIDDRRAEVLRGQRAKVYPGNALSTNFEQVFGVADGFDYVIANPPFGPMEAPTRFDKIPNVTKVDHFIALRALAARKAQGRAVLIIGADDRASDGTIKGSSTSFFNYLYDHYEVQGAVEVDGRLYARSGAQFNVRLLVIGDRRPEPVQQDVPSRLDTISTYDELWDWSSRIIEPQQPEAAKTESAVAESPDERGQDGQEAPGGRTDLQIPYQPASSTGEASTRIPVNMAGATYAALGDFKALHGDIDTFVAQRLGYGVDELAGYFSPEQVDALGLAIKAVEEDRGIINADQTGIGKGRFVAAMLRYARLHGKRPIFLTVKPELFTDIFRDISDIGSLQLFEKPFIFNDGVRVVRYGTEDETLFPATPVVVRRQALDDGELPQDTDLVLATYSQFMVAASRNRKTALLTSVADQDSMLILDEAHVAAGQSNIGDAISAAVDGCGSVVYASATPLKGVNNFFVYRKVFPASVDIARLPDTLKAGGETLLEAISTNMARDGVLVRREHDFSNLTFNTHYPDEANAARNIELSNRLSEIFSVMSYLSGDVEKEVTLINKELESEWKELDEDERRGKRMQASSMNFGSRLYNLNRQFLLAIKIDDAISVALRDLQEGRKPVIAVENTGESLLREVIARRLGIQELQEELADLDERRSQWTPEDVERREFISQKISDALRNAELDSLPQYRELLEIVLDRIGSISIRDRYGDTYRKRADSSAYLSMEKALREKIREFPDLPLSPIDVFRTALNRQGYQVGEVSGRTVSLHETGNGVKWRVQFHEKADAVSNVAGFQNGRLDAIVITRSGSTGISLHATKRFADSDYRQRDFIVLQKAANIAEFLQWMGRVNRKDQVVAPVITSLESGLPAELRLGMMHNAKLRLLSANMTSNRKNVNVEEGAVDLLNEVGDTVAQEFLAANPEIAKALDIKLPKPGEGKEAQGAAFSQDCACVNKLLGRLVMLDVAQQNFVIEQMAEGFADKLAELEEMDSNPFKIEVYDWKARIEDEEMLEGHTLDGGKSVFDAPITVATLTFDEVINPIRTDRLLGMIKEGQKKFEAMLGKDAEGGMSESEFMNRIDEAKQAYVLRFVESEDAREALKGAFHIGNSILETNDGARAAFNKANWLRTSLRQMRPGHMIQVSDFMNGVSSGFITSVEWPTKEVRDIFSLSKYRAKVVFPGQGKPKEISLERIFRQEQSNAFPIVRIDARKPLHDQVFRRELDPFDYAPQGLRQRKVHVMRGNIFKCCELAATHKIGKTILYTDEAGTRQRAVMLKKGVSLDAVKSMPVALSNDMVMRYIEMARGVYEKDKAEKGKNADYLKSYVQIRSSPSESMGRSQDGISLEVRFEYNNAFLVVPGAKSKAGNLHADGDIFDLGKKSSPTSLRIPLAGTRASMQATVPMETVPELIERLTRNGHVPKFYVAKINPEIIKQIREAVTPSEMHDQMELIALEPDEEGLDESFEAGLP